MRSVAVLLFAVIAVASCTILEIQVSYVNNNTQTVLGKVNPNNGVFTTLTTFRGSSAPYGDRSAYDYVDRVYSIILATTVNVSNSNYTTTTYSLAHVNVDTGAVIANLPMRIPYAQIPTGIEYGNDNLVGFIRDGYQWYFSSINKQTAETRYLTSIGLWNYQQFSSAIDRDSDVYYATIFVPTDSGPLTNIIAFNPVTGKLLSNATLTFEGQFLYRSILGLAWDNKLEVLFGLMYKQSTTGSVYSFVSINPETGGVKIADVFPPRFSSTHSVAYDEDNSEYYLGMQGTGGVNGNYIISFNVQTKTIQKQTRVQNPVSGAYPTQGGLQFMKDK